MAQAKNGLKKWLPRVLAIGLGVALVLAVVSAWIPKPMPVELAAAEKGPMVVEVREDGRSRLKDRYVVSAPLMANVGRIELHEGDVVKAGQVVARMLPTAAPLLDPRTRAQSRARLAGSEAAFRQAQAGEQRAKAQLAYSEKDIQRIRQLAKNGSVTRQVLDRAELEFRATKEEAASAAFGVRVARYDMELARAALGRIRSGDKTEQMSITAPVDGVVLQVHQANAGVVQPGQPLIEIGDPSNMEIVVDVLTADAVKIVRGAKASIEGWGGELALTAQVRRVEPKAFTRMSSLGVEEQRVNVILDLRDPSDVWKSLGDGFRVEARIVTWQKDVALTVPLGAIFREKGGWVTYKMAKGRAALQPLEIGHRNGLAAEVLDGLAEGDEVVVHPGEQIKDGVMIELRESDT